MSKVPQPDLMQDPPADWLEANGFIPEGFPCMEEKARLALRAAYQADLMRHDVPFPEVLVGVVPDYSQLPAGVEPGSLEEYRLNQFLEQHYGYNDTSNPEIAA